MTAIVPQNTDFGRDTSCTTELRTGRFARGARLVAEAAFRRLTTPRGMLRGGEVEAEYGLDLLGLVGSVTTKGDAAALGGRIESELRKDERIVSVVATVVEVVEGPATSWDISVEAETSAGPFALKIGVDELSVELLSITAEA